MFYRYLDGIDAFAIALEVALILLGGLSGEKHETTNKNRGKLIAKGRKIPGGINEANSNAKLFICERHH